MQMKPDNPRYMLIMLSLVLVGYVVLWYRATEHVPRQQSESLPDLNLAKDDVLPQDSLPLADYLNLANEALSQDKKEKAISYYEQGLKQLKESNSGKDDEESLVIVLSLHTNHGSALSAVGRNQEAAEQYQLALQKYANQIEDIVEDSFKREVTDVAAQASFFLGMVYQDMGQYHDSVDAYSQANILDPYHWASVANLAAVYHDNLAEHRMALDAYNKAYEILTKQDVEPTDPPTEPRFILSQLQYRIGLCISHDLNAKCALEENPDKPLSCKELATNAFAQALEYDPSNEVS